MIFPSIILVMMSRTIPSAIIGAVVGAAASQNFAGAALGAFSFAFGNEACKGSSLQTLAHDYTNKYTIAAISAGVIASTLSPSFCLRDVVATIGTGIFIRGSFNVVTKFHDPDFNSPLLTNYHKLFSAFSVVGIAIQANRTVQSLIQGNAYNALLPIASIGDPRHLRKDKKVVYVLSSVLGAANAIAGGNKIAAFLFGAIAIAGISDLSLLPLEFYCKKDKLKMVSSHFLGLANVAIGLTGLHSVSDINPLFITLPTVAAKWLWASYSIYKQGLTNFSDTLPLNAKAL